MKFRRTPVGEPQFTFLKGPMIFLDFIILTFILLAINLTFILLAINLTFILLAIS